MANSHEGWATCPITQLGFVRISCIPHVLPAPTTVKLATDVLRKWTQRSDHHFWADQLPAVDALALGPALVGHQQITDAYLIQLAIKNGGTLATFDRGLRKRAGVEVLDSGDIAS